MGALNAEPLKSLAQLAAKKYGVTDFIETGTHEGTSAAFAASIFPRVTTIEISDVYRQTAIARHGKLGIRFLLGDSRTVLPPVVKELEKSAFFWLDGHAGGGNYGTHEDCPVLAELAAIADSPYEHFVLVDDARAFVAPPPPPFRAEAWPTLPEIFDVIRRKTKYYCVVLNDAVFCVPPAAKEDMIALCTMARPKI
ncbi:MAG: hypothetical protein U0570_07085 [Phycisphaerales bacterium]